ncbi:hypothetical protein LX16_2264 [Stackebrandtia albiflava]|uniref:Uncharacterized protein n=1 Tax=Stackebrandtia albiflava TaxID=406432 RepID=A0A562V0W4_9ACTN|nr:hypothetical protein [Stackebrandtia albiflava]TWJ11539.1 hypothetical protein LX16_2264 [Stackebrandtia albiflava]
MAKYIGRHRRDRIARADKTSPAARPTQPRRSSEEREPVAAGH